MRNRFTEEQIIGVLKEAEAGMKVAEVCRKYGISDVTYYNWKAKSCGMTGRAAAEDLEGENLNQASRNKMRTSRASMENSGMNA